MTRNKIKKWRRKKEQIQKQGTRVGFTAICHICSCSLNWCQKATLIFYPTVSTCLIVLVQPENLSEKSAKFSIVTENRIFPICCLPGILFTEKFVTATFHISPEENIENKRMANVRNLFQNNILCCFLDQKLHFNTENQCEKCQKFPLTGTNFHWKSRFKIAHLNRFLTNGHNTCAIQSCSMGKIGPFGEKKLLRGNWKCKKTSLIKRMFLFLRSNFSIRS